MIAKDLMIGDYVRTFHGEYGRVTSINIFQHTSNCIDVCGKTYDEDRIKAIPLTEEMLEQNGFKIFEHGDPLDSLWTISGTCLLFETTSLPTRFYTKWVLYDEFKTPRFSILAVQYVHELQHALRLCGLDNLADNFTI